MSRQTILLVFGGESSEHDVSIMSARNVYEALDQHKYDVLLCYIPRDGRSWQYVRDFTGLEGPIIKPVMGTGSIQVSDKTIAIDVLLPVLHGSNGEDGSIQGFAQLLHVHCVGPSIESAVVTMDKDMTKRLLERESIPVVPWYAWLTSNERPRYEELTQLLGDVLFVKPSTAGSSVGVSKVVDQKTLDTALDEAARHSGVVLVERAIDAREMELAVLGTRTPEITSPGEILPGEEFYSYADKYEDTSTSAVAIPADIDEQQQRQLRDYALRAYLATGGTGMARVDFFIDKYSGDIYLNEINSIPGFTNISMYPKLWQYEGVSYGELLDRLIQLASEE